MRRGCRARCRPRPGACFLALADQDIADLPQAEVAGRGVGLRIAVFVEELTIGPAGTTPGDAVIGRGLRLQTRARQPAPTEAQRLQ